MQNIRYNNINCKFVFDDISSLFTKFWINEVTTKKQYKKIWLTIIVNHSNDKSFTLINNLPFTTDNYTDILIVIKQVFEINVFNDKDVLNNIVFKYYLEHKDNSKRKLYFKNILIYVLFIIIIILLFCISIILWEICYTYSIQHIDEEVLNYAYENTKYYDDYKEHNQISTKKQCIFNPFIELFNGNNYSPSKFGDDDSYFWAWEYLNNQDNKVEDKTISFSQALSDLQNRIKNYENLVKDLNKMLEDGKKTLEK